MQININPSAMSLHIDIHKKCISGNTIFLQTEDEIKFW